VGDGVVSLSAPVLEVDNILSLLGLGTGWILNLSKVNLIVLGVGNSIISLSTPVLNINNVFSLLSFSSSWGGGLGSLLRVQLGVGLDEGAVLESALDEVEEVSDELGLLLLVDTSKKLGIHLLLEEFVHVNLEISLKEGLFSNGDLVHVSIHAHSFNLRLHLLLGLDLNSLSGRGQ
jgi:hypothetical protein